jgi:hypothetical protein
MHIEATMHNSIAAHMLSLQNFSPGGIQTCVF